MQRSRLLVTVPAEQGLRQATGSLIMTLGKIMTSPKSSPVRSGLLVALISAAILSLVAYLVPGGWSHVFSEIKAFVGAIFDWLSAPTGTKNWIFYGLLVFACMVIVGLVFVFIAAMLKKPEESYTEDTFGGVKWRWRFYYGKMVSLCSFCPNCDMQVHPQRASSYRALSSHVFKCPDCGWRSEEVQGEAHDIEQGVTLLIQRELRRRQK